MPMRFHFVLSKTKPLSRPPTSSNPRLSEQSPHLHMGTAGTAESYEFRSVHKV